MIPITTTANTVIVDTTSLVPTGFLWAKATYNRRLIVYITQDASGRFLEVSVLGEPRLWKITDTATWLALQPNEQGNTLPIATIDGVAVTDINHLHQLAAGLII